VSEHYNASRLRYTIFNTALSAHGAGQHPFSSPDILRFLQWQILNAYCQLHLLHAVYLSYLHIKFEEEIKGNPFEFQAKCLTVPSVVLHLCFKFYCIFTLLLLCSAFMRIKIYIILRPKLN